MSIFSFLFGSKADEPVKPAKSKISLEQLETMFASMRAKTEWDLDGDMLWGYFFFDPDRKKLDQLANQLSATGYHFVDIYPASEGNTFVLHVERIEHHTPKTLDARNQELEGLARKFHVSTYDGMDVGPVSPKPN